MSTANIAHLDQADEQALADLVERFARAEIAPFVTQWDAAGEFPRALYQRAGQLGLLGMGYPEQFGGTPVDWLAAHPMGSIIAMVSWEWTPFAMLILLTGLQSLPDDQIEAARLDGANPWQEFRHIVLPHWTQALEVVILLETINVLQVYGEIYASTSGGPGVATTNLPYYIYQRALAEGNIGVGSAAGVIAVILTNVLAIFMLRLINKNATTGGHA